MAIVIAVAVSVAFGAGCRSRDKTAVSLGELPSFTLVDQHGVPFSSAKMVGKIWVIDFIFTSCPTICPKLTDKMKQLAAEVSRPDGSVQFLSISVDPEHDTPQVLSEYTKKRGAVRDNWTFLTGDSDAIRKAVVEGFKFALGERSARDDGRYDIMHASHFVLVNGDGEIRGYFRPDGEGLYALRQAISKLLD
ncbi:MAG: SCO family protein [Polyangiales bacterium]